MSKQIKRSILIISIFIVIILIAIVLIKLNQLNNKKEEENEIIQEAEQVKIEDVEIEKRTYMYLYSNDVLNKVFDYISNTEKNAMNEEALINILDNEYKQKYNITEENVLKILSNYKNINSYFTKEIYRKDIAQRQNINGRYYYIKGVFRKDGKEENIYVLMKQDLKNSTYSISILTEQEFNQKGKEEEIVIQKNSYNETYIMQITDYQICLELFNDYKNTIENNPEKAYELLDQEYKIKRFGTLENYLKYINSIKDKLSNAILKEYSIQNGEANNQYICVDQIGNYYIFEQNEMMNYTLKLDSYTIEIPEITEAYNNANTMKKVGYNIQRCIEAINNKDYSYIYGKLDNEFKNNNYKTLSDFEKTIKNKMYDSNLATTISSRNEGITYIYELKITSTKDENKNTNMTIIMQLKEGTDFVMSFSFN